MGIGSVFEWEEEVAAVTASLRQVLNGGFNESNSAEINDNHSTYVRKSGGWVGGWGGWADGWVGGWVDGSSSASRDSWGFAHY